MDKKGFMVEKPNARFILKDQEEIEKTKRESHFN